METREFEFLSLKHAHEYSFAWLSLHVFEAALVVCLLFVVGFNVIRAMLGY
jgi:hypothetical protein